MFESVILGLIQGLTEFLPISSSGHLLIIEKFFRITDNTLAFDATLHLATLAAVIVALKSELQRLIVGIYKKNSDGRLAGWIIFSSLPVLLIGFFFNDWIETAFRSVAVVAFTLVFFGLFLWWADTRAIKNKEFELTKIGWKKTLIISLSQILAFFPGVSRSGISITVGLFSGLSRQAAARFSFLLGLPSIAAAGGFSLLKIILNGGNFDWLALGLAFVSAFVSGFLAIKLLLKIINGVSYRGFVFYRIILALVIILFWL